VVEVADLAWLALLGTVADLGASLPFPAVRGWLRVHGRQHVSAAVSLLNAARRAPDDAVEDALSILQSATAPRASLVRRSQCTSRGPRYAEPAKEMRDMPARYFALVSGIVYAIVGVLGFLPGLLTPLAAEPDMAVTSLYGRLLGLFPVNILHSIVHLAIGIWGILAYATWRAARTYAASLAVIYGVLAIMGLIPGLNTVLGLIPLFGHDVWLHAVTAVIAAYFGFARRAEHVAASDQVRRAA